MSVTMRQTREAFLLATPSETSEVTTPLLAQILGLTSESQRQIVRRQLLQLSTRGEAIKVRMGVWRRNFAWTEPRRGDGYTKIWRGVRCQEATWTLRDIASVTRIEYTTVLRYARYLEDAGLIRRAGRQGQAALWRMTAAGREHRTTPWPPKDAPSPYRKELAAVVGLLQALTQEDPQTVSARRKIRAALDVLWEKFCTQDESTTEEESHAE